MPEETTQSPSLEALRKVIEMSDSSRVTKEDFTKLATQIMELVKAIVARNDQEKTQMRQMVQSSLSEVKSRLEAELGQIRASLQSSMDEQMTQMRFQHEAMMAECKAVLDDVEDGEDADEDEIVEKVIAQLPQKEEPKEETAESILEKLGLTMDDLKELKKKKSYAPVGGPYSAVMPYVPTIQAVVSGTVDDSNLTFTFDQKPSIVCVNGANYRENHGWAWSGGAVVLDGPVGTNGDIYSIL